VREGAEFTFPTSGVTTWLWLPLGIAFLLAFFGAMAGGAGAILLGGLFGHGGLIGGYLGERCQKYVAQRPIKLGLMLVLRIVASRYLLDFLFY
jgi:hypothetical protein